MKKCLMILLTAVLALSSLTSPAYAQQSRMVSQPQASMASEDFGEIAYNHLIYLSGYIGSRAADNIAGEDVPESDPELMTTAYIYYIFMSLGYEVEIQPFTFTSDNKDYESSNIVATKRGKSDKAVIVGAHYDIAAPKVWLNPPEEGTAKTAGKAYMCGKGADDNASGVSIMLEAAERVVDIEMPYTIEFVAFGAEEKGKKGSEFYVTQMSEEDIEDTVAMINLDSCIAGNNMYVYGNEDEDGWVRELALEIGAHEGLNQEYPAGTTVGRSDHEPFAELGIPYAYFEAADWTLGAMGGYTQVDPEYGIDGEIRHTGYDNIGYIEEEFPVRIEDRLRAFSKLLTNMLVQIEKPNKCLSKSR